MLFLPAARFLNPMSVINNTQSFGKLEKRALSCRVCVLVQLQVVPGSIWIFEQEQSLALSGVSTTVRMTVVRLQSSGGLFIYSPIAPTK